MGLAITTRPTQTHAAPTELGSLFGGCRSYKHGARNGACPPVASTDARKEQELAGAFGAPPLSESASKLDALHTLRAEDNRHRAIIRQGIDDPKRLASLAGSCPAANGRRRKL